MKQTINGNPGRPKRVFIAENSGSMRQRPLDLFLEQPHMEVVGTARDGVETIQSVHLLKPGVSILDIQMPRKSGLGVLRAVRKEKSHCADIVVTKLSDESCREKCQELKADYFFDKLAGFNQFVDLLKK